MDEHKRFLFPTSHEIKNIPAIEQVTFFVFSNTTVTTNSSLSLFTSIRIRKPNLHLIVLNRETIANFFKQYFLQMWSFYKHEYGTVCRTKIWKNVISVASENPHEWSLVSVIMFSKRSFYEICLMIQLRAQ